MQQTEKYQLNLIETSDVFSPAALNENAQKLETALSAEAQARAAADAAEAQARTQADAALDQRIQVLELHRMVAGTYIGNGSTSGQKIELGFTPEVIITDPTHESRPSSVLCLRDQSAGLMEIVPGGFVARVSPNFTYDNRSLNTLNRYYCYLALC